MRPGAEGPGAEGPGAGGPGAEGQGMAGRGVAAQSAGVPAARPGRSPARLRRRRRRSFVLSAVAVVALAVGVPAIAQADQAAVFGSRELDLKAGDSVDVGVLFGSVKVTVHDGAPVQLDGNMIFGSPECHGCGTSSTAAPVHVHGRGAFGSIEVVRGPHQADPG